jgi:hypothetical protein
VGDTRSVNPVPDEQPYGIVFVGPPGEFSVWTETPHGDLMNREAVEQLGQIASLAGANDYRVYPLDSTPDGARFIPAGDATKYESLIVACGGVPPPSKGGGGI